MRFFNIPKNSNKYISLIRDIRVFISINKIDLSYQIFLSSLINMKEHLQNRRGRKKIKRNILENTG